MVLGQWSTGLAVGYLASSLVAGINDINSVITEGGGLSFEHADRVTGRGPTSYELKERTLPNRYSLRVNFRLDTDSDIV